MQSLNHLPKSSNYGARVVQGSGIQNLTQEKFSFCGVMSQDWCHDLRLTNKQRKSRCASASRFKFKSAANKGRKTKPGFLSDPASCPHEQGFSDCAMFSLGSNKYLQCIMKFDVKKWREFTMF